jgi:radical SAM protein with 4Fe4S-binding SPASM domain
MSEIFEVVNIETHNLCNRKCSFCKFGQSKENISASFMPIDIIEQISSELSELKFEGRVHFTGINEPLIDKRITEIISKFKCLSGKKSLTTNGDYLDDEMLARLEESGLTHLNVSVYSDDHYEEIKKNCEGWSYGIVDMRMNQQRIYNVISNRAGSLDLNEMFDKEIVQIRSRLSRDRGCSRPFQYITVVHTGEVILCPEDMYASCVMGDLRENSLMEVWGNEKFLRYRETLKSEGRKNLAPCQNCNFNGRKTKEKGKELRRI